MYITKFLVVRGLPIAWPAGKFPVPVVESRDRSGDSRQKHVAAAPYFDCRPAVPGSWGNPTRVATKQSLSGLQKKLKSLLLKNRFLYELKFVENQEIHFT
jgi:hypothetical protein